MARLKTVAPVGNELPSDPREGLDQGKIRLYNKGEPGFFALTARGSNMPRTNGRVDSFLRKPGSSTHLRRGLERA
jgi:hypothetical protein